MIRQQSKLHTYKTRLHSLIYYGGGDVTQNNGTGNICIGSNNNLAGAPPNTIAIGNNIGQNIGDVVNDSTFILGSISNNLLVVDAVPLVYIVSYLNCTINGYPALIPFYHPGAA